MAPIYAAMIVIAIYFGINAYVRHKVRTINEKVKSGFCMECGMNIDNCQCTKEKDEPPKEPPPSTLKTRDYYKILGVAPDATQAQIKSRFYDLAKMPYPDKSSKEYEDNLSMINKAYETLSDKKLRNDYDKHHRSA